MSRLDQKFISIPAKVSIEHQGQLITINGGKGTLKHQLHSNVFLEVANNQIKVLRKDDTPLSKALQGTTFVVISNSIKGVTEGFIKKLQLIGVGYKAQMITDSKLKLAIGKSHPVEYLVPAGVKVEILATNTSSMTEIVVSGIDKQLIGQVAANIRNFKKPEPYKGKGIRYFDEVIQLKESKSKSKKK